MNKMKRFVPGISNDVGVTMIQHDYGGYVEYASASAAIDALTTELSVAKKWGAELQRSLIDAQAAAIQHAERADQNERERIIAQDRLDREQAENMVFRDRIILLSEKDAEIKRLKAAIKRIDEKYHWWNEDCYKNCQSVVAKAIHDAMRLVEGSESK